MYLPAVTVNAWQVASTRISHPADLVEICIRFALPTSGVALPAWLKRSAVGRNLTLALALVLFGLQYIARSQLYTPNPSSRVHLTWDMHDCTTGSPY